MTDRTLAVDIDDTLNDFTEILRDGEFVRQPDEPLGEERFQAYLKRVRAGPGGEGELLSTEFTYFRARIHLQCFARAQPRPGAAEFLRQLRGEGWRVVICTSRDLRRAHDLTREWLTRHDIPFDQLFMAANKIAFCAFWGIRHLIDDDLFSVAHGGRHGVQVYYPATAKHQGVDAAGARGFSQFAELRPWIRA